MTTPPIRLPAGVRDFLPRAAARRRALAEAVMEVFEAWGYARIITPMFECADVLERGLGIDARAAAIRFVEPGTGEIVALRPDITPQIARVVATRLADVPGPIRLCYEGAVTRLVGDLGQREILQAGVELIDAVEVGADWPLAADADAGAVDTQLAGDAEVLAVASAVLARLELGETRLDIGHVAPARFVLDAAPDPGARRALVAAISRKDRAGVRSAARALPADIAPFAEALVALWGPSAATLERASAQGWPAPIARVFGAIAARLAALDALDHDPRRRVSLDFGDLRGFDYYTGIRFAAYAAGAPDAILRGGRYDELIGRYGRPARATGFAIDLEAVAQAHHDAGVVTRAVMGVAIHRTDAPAFARLLRGRGVRAVVQAGVQGTWGAWLRGAGLDAAILDDRVIRSDDSVHPAGPAIEAARAGDIEPLIALIRT